MDNTETLLPHELPSVLAIAPAADPDAPDVPPSSEASLHPRRESGEEASNRGLDNRADSDEQLSVRVNESEMAVAAESEQVSKAHSCPFSHSFTVSKSARRLLLKDSTVLATTMAPASRQPTESAEAPAVVPAAAPEAVVPATAPAAVVPAAAVVVPAPSMSEVRQLCRRMAQWTCGWVCEWHSRAR
jgi:hypothetical protein